MKAYGFKAKDDILSKLLELNFELAAKEKQDESVIGAESPYVMDVFDIASEFQNILEEVNELENLSAEQRSQAKNSKSLSN